MKKALAKGAIAHVIVYMLLSLPLLFVTSEVWIFILRLIAVAAATTAYIMVFNRNYERVIVVKMDCNDDERADQIARMLEAVGMTMCDDAQEKKEG